MVNVCYDASIRDVHICVPIPYETIEAPESILVNTSSVCISNLGYRYHVSNTLTWIAVPRVTGQTFSSPPLEVLMTEIVMNRWERTMFNVWRCMLIHTLNKI